MKISTCTVSYEGYSYITGNDSRLDLLERSIIKLKKENVMLATFPGGFLFAKNIGHAKKLGNQLKVITSKYNIYIALGIDINQKPLSESDVLVKNYSLPAIAMIVSPNKEKLHLWRQRSSSSKNQIYADDKICNEKRTLKINSKTIEILMCGEIFSEKIRSSIIRRGIDVIVDLGHKSAGFRVTFPMKKLAACGIKTFCSVHAQVKNAMKHSYVPENPDKFKKLSVRSTGIVLGSYPRIEIAIWKI